MAAALRRSVAAKAPTTNRQSGSSGFAESGQRPPLVSAQTSLATAAIWWIGSRSAILGEIEWKQRLNMPARLVDLGQKCLLFLEPIAHRLALCKESEPCLGL
jgi:hypothetical protein